jgi:hypothetical protein
MRSASFSLTGSPLQAKFFDRKKARRSAGLFVLGQFAGSLVLVLVLTAGVLAVGALVSVLVSTNNLLTNPNLDARQSVAIQNSGDQRQRTPQK